MNLTPIQFMQYAAKAVAAFLAPWVLVGLAWVAKWLGIDVEEIIDLDSLETYIATAVLAIFQAIWVYWQRNKSKLELEGEERQD